MNSLVVETLQMQFKAFNLDVLTKMEIYKSELKEYNSHTNVTALIHDDEIDEKHYFDSLILNRFMSESGQRVIDIGSGAGFPGLVLGILQKENYFVLVESIAKKTRFLAQITSKLELPNIEIYSKRAEELIKEKNWHETFDFGVCRAVASLNVMLELVIPYLKVGGKLLAQKVNYEDEVKLAENALKELGCEIIEVEEYILPITNQKRFVLIIEKKSETSKKYPRTVKQIIKKPL
ncbi:MAG: 16S rRNA (guanine(527)-N(7))-methyltransferase RsmG [Fusobacteria bacterium]|nr:16S rRNA (guanine(527)-N(7))-methyltransferase RsmG [Fusobacteriota bacterium]